MPDQRPAKGSYRTVDAVADVLLAQGVLFDGTQGHNQRKAIAASVMETVRVHIINLIDPAMTGVEVKQAVLDLLAANPSSTP